MPVLPEEIESYASAHTTPEPSWLLAAARATAVETSSAQMLTGHLAGRFLEFVVWALQPRLVVEVGTFTGYAAMSMAAGLPDGGRVITCELDARHAALARAHIAASPYSDRIELREGPALETLASMTQPVDFAFVDADKENYLNYYEALVPKLSERGAIAVDNVLWSGRVLDPTVSDAATEAIRALNERVRNDDRVTCVIATVRDGLTLIRRR